MPREREHDRVAIITGASSGIGADLARELHRRGWKVGLLARREEPLRALAAELGAGAAWATADVTDYDGLKTAVAALEATLGQCHLMVANAGVATFTPSWRFDPEVARGVMRTNFDGVVNAFSAVLPAMLERGSGHLAATSSVAGFRGLPVLSVYSASKAAVTQFLEGLRVEVEPRGLQVTVVHPGFVDTDLVKGNRFPMPFLLTSAETARAMADGLERRRAEVALPWPMVMSLRLGTVLPRLLYQPLVRAMFMGRRRKGSPAPRGA